MVAETTSDALSYSLNDYPFELSIKGQGLKLEDAQSCDDLCSKIRAQKCLKVLRLEGNTLGVQAALHIGRALKQHTELERLIMNDVFTGRLKTEIPKALENLFSEIRTSGVNLIELNLSDNAFGPIGMDSLISILKSPCCYNLIELRLHNNGLGIQGAKGLSEALKYLTSGLRKLKLKTLICGRNRLENEGSTYIASALQNACSLEEIQMPQNGICADGAIAMFKALENHPNMKIINFNDNTISVDGSFYMSKILPNMTNLKHLNLGDCLIQNGGIVEIATAISDLKQLHHVIFSSNEIGDSAAFVLLENLKSMNSLELIDLRNNDFTDEFKNDMKKSWLDINTEIHLSDDEEFESEYDSEESDELPDKKTAEPKSFIVPVKNFTIPSQKKSFFTDRNSNTPSRQMGSPLFPINFPRSVFNKSKDLSIQSKVQQPKSLPTIQPLFNQFGKLNVNSTIEQTPIQQEEEPSEHKLIKRIRRKLDAPQNSKNTVTISPSIVNLHYNMILHNQRFLDPSHLNIFVPGILSIASMLDNPGFTNEHAKLFIDESLLRMCGMNLHTDNMHGARTIIYYIEHAKYPSFRQKAMRICSEFIINHPSWKQQERQCLYENMQRLNHMFSNSIC